MKYEPKKVFTIENGTYTEHTYQEFCAKENTHNGDRCFIPVQGMLLEVTSEQYKEFYRDKERYRYLKKLDIGHGLFSLDGSYGDNSNTTEFIPSSSESVEDIVIANIMTNRLRECIRLLAKEEQELLCRHYYDEISEVELSCEYGITQQAISKRLKKIRLKLKEMLE